MAKPRSVIAPGRVRCAIYTRKSSEEGLDQAFNSLHAQREACEAYVASQAGEGWSALTEAYDDGGFSGGNLERPAMKRLLVDIRRGLVDVVVVYKVDRLTRSLTDFAKIVDGLDAHGVSFVSVTQAFNTTTSMGRLTLNVLLSFAQFEREVTGERIRDKIAASKAKGMWMGGMVPLGYDAQDRALVINPPEAETVRHLFQRYLELKSVHRLCDELRAEGALTKAWLTRGGRTLGGCAFTRGTLFHLLQSRLYIGQIVHKDQVYPGLHPPIIDQDLFDAVQVQLAAHRKDHRDRPLRAAASPLTGLIFDADGAAMGPSFGYGRRGGLYRYYISTSVQAGRRAADNASDAIRRVPAPAMEQLVLDRLAGLAAQGGSLDWERAKSLLIRVEVYPRQIHIVVDQSLAGDPHEAPEATRVRLSKRMEPGSKLLLNEGGRLVLVVPVRAVFRGGRQVIVLPAGASTLSPARSDPSLARTLRTVHRVLERVSASPLLACDAFASASAIADSDIRKLAPLAFLAPDLQRALLEGRGKKDLNVAELIKRATPLAWADQRAL